MMQSQLTNKRILASPLAKKTAKELNIELSSIIGTGPGGRIIRDDVEKFNNNDHKFLRKKDHSIPLSMMETSISKRVSVSKQQIPHFYLTSQCDVYKLLNFRNEINMLIEKNSLMDGVASQISINDLLIKAASIALEKNPNINVGYSDGEKIEFGNIDISVAVAINDGLVTPLVKYANQKNILTISKEMKELCKLAKSQKLKPHQYEGGSFTISNLGMYDIVNFYPIINPPQGAIMGIGTIQSKCQDTSKIINISLCCDHRVINGAVAANFLSSFKNYLKEPMLMTNFY